MLDKLLYYLVVLPLSKMPYSIIYLISDVFFVILIKVFPYRGKVITQNLLNSFPDKSSKEIEVLKVRFYRYFADLMLETIKLLGISKRQLLKRITLKNREVISDLTKQGKSFILLSSHYNNWEYIILAQDLLFPQQAIGIGMPLSNKYWHKKITSKRVRFGMRVIDPKSYKDLIKGFTEKTTSTLVLNDQSPGKSKNCYWTQFLNQETAFYFGAEVMAHELDLPVVYLELEKKQRGFYNFKLALITDKPKEKPYGFITQYYINNLERAIQLNPEYWLWSHKRWKKKIPKNLEALKEEHQERFNNRFFS